MLFVGAVSTAGYSDLIVGTKFTCPLRTCQFTFSLGFRTKPNHREEPISTECGPLEISVAPTFDLTPLIVLEDWA